MSSLPASISAGLLLAAISVLKTHDLPAPSALSVLQATGATKTTAYKAKGAIERALPGLLRPPGRPPKLPDLGNADTRLALAHQVRDFLFDHPGCVSGSSLRRNPSAKLHGRILGARIDRVYAPS